MKRLLMVLVCSITTIASAQSAEFVRRVRPNQTDLAIRTAIPHVSLEMGQVQTDVVHDGWAYLVTDFRIGNWSLGAEAFTAPEAEFVSHTSIGGTIGRKISTNLSTTGRYVMYRNPDASFQRLYTMSVDYTKSSFGVGVSLGELTGTDLPIGQIRLSRNGSAANTLVYVSRWMEVPELPWATWVVNEVGITHRFTIHNHVSAHVGVAHGLSDQRYTAVSMGLRVFK